MTFLRRNTPAVVFAVSLFFMIIGDACAWRGEVIGVSDGDTITVMHEGKGVRIRLYGVDTPEKHQDFGEKAKQFTSDIVFRKMVDVQPVTTDRYGRTVGIVSTDDGHSLNEDLVRAGFAWVYRQYCTRAECLGWNRLEIQAKDNGLGLWSMSNPTPPWEFRHSGKPVESRSAPESPKPQQAVSEQANAAYHGNVSSHIFHRRGCRYYDCHNCVVSFESRQEAVAAGYRPCKICRP